MLRLWRLARLCLVASAFVLGGGAGVAGAAPVGSQTQVSIASPANSAGSPNPAAAYDPVNDRYLVVWASEQGDPGTAAIWGRFEAADGSVSLPPFRIMNVGAVGDKRGMYEPRVIYSRLLRRYLVAANGESGAAGAGDWEIYGTWLSELGDRIGDIFPISGGAGFSVHPQLALDDARGGIAVIHWGAGRPGGPTYNTYGVVVTTSGVGTTRRITEDVSMDHPWSTIAAGSGGEFLVADQLGVPNSPNNDTTEVIRVSADMTPIGTPVRFSPTGSALTLKPSVAWNAARSEYAVAFPEATPGGNEIVAQRYSPTLQPLGGPVQLSHMGPEGAPAYGTTVDVSLMAVPGSDQYAAFWIGDTLDATHIDGQLSVWGTTVAGDLSALGPQFEVSQIGPLPATVNEIYALTGGAVAYDSARGRWLVPFHGRTAASPETQVFTRLVEPYRAPAAPTAVAPDAGETAREGAASPAPAGVAASAACPGARSYATRKGARCAPAPTAPFQVSPVANGSNHKVLRGVVSPTVKGQTATAACVDRCAKRSKASKAKGAKRTTSLSLTPLRINTGSTIEIRLAQPGFTTRYVQLKVTKKFPYLMRTEAGCRMTDDLKATC